MEILRISRCYRLIELASRVTAKFSFLVVLSLFDDQSVCASSAAFVWTFLAKIETELFVLCLWGYLQLTEDRNSLMKQYEGSGVLQLKQLSLCSVGFTERFLWVQNLDLTYNQLRSTQGNVLSRVF